MTYKEALDGAYAVYGYQSDPYRLVWRGGNTLLWFSNEQQVDTITLDTLDENRPCPSDVLECAYAILDEMRA